MGNDEKGVEVPIEEPHADVISNFQEKGKEEIRGKGSGNYTFVF